MKWNDLKSKLLKDNPEFRYRYYSGTTGVSETTATKTYNWRKR